MNKATIGRITVQLLVALLLSVFVSRTTSVSQVSPCIYAAGCIDRSGLVGKVTIQQRGFPVAYREVSTFEPNSQDRYAAASSEVRTPGSHNAFVTVLIDVVFWYALLAAVYGGLVSGLRRKVAKKD